jgi:hypothetical protein
VCVYKRIVKMNMIIGNCKKKKKKRSSRYFSSYLFCSFLSPSNELMIQTRLKTNSNIPQQNSNLLVSYMDFKTTYFIYGQAGVIENTSFLKVCFSY